MLVLCVGLMCSIMTVKLNEWIRLRKMGLVDMIRTGCQLEVLAIVPVSRC